MINIEKKMKHIAALKRTSVELNRRIELLEKDLQKDMLAEYAAVNTATTN